LFALCVWLLALSRFRTCVANRPVRPDFDKEDTMTEIDAPSLIPQEHVLLHELNHRINNEFAAAIGIVTVAAARSGNAEAKAALTGVAELFHRYADVHRLLQMPDHDTLVDAAAYLRQLCLSISRSRLDARRISLVLSAQSLRLQAERCWRLGMIVHELISNAARHAFANRGGAIRVAVWQDGAFVKCSVQDSGSVTASIQPGHGLKIVNSLSRALGGRLRQTFGVQGSKSLLVFPHDCAPAVNAERPLQGKVQKPERDAQAFGEEPSLAPGIEPLVM
jgi:two-component sensor histidine kinase